MPIRRHGKQSTGCRCQSLEPRRLLAVQPVADINTAPLTAAQFGAIVAVNDTVFFAVDDAMHGQELWRADPGGGASLVKDIYPGPVGSKPANLVAIGDTLYFTADAPGVGAELWKTDGTEGGTVMIADLIPGLVSSRPYGFRRFGTHIYFIAPEPSPLQHYALWRTDGTTSGTSVIHSVTGSDVSQMAAPVVVSDRLVFASSSWSSAGAGVLWASDGTPQGTAPIKSFPGFGGPDSFAVTADGTLFFVARGDGAPRLWMTDGTTAGTVRLGNVRPSADGLFGNPLTVAGDAIYFRGDDDPLYGSEVWTSDGTPIGTRLVRDINPGTAGSDPWYFAAAADGSVYFSANDGAHGHELWHTDGTEGGTALVADLSPGVSGSFPSHVAAAGPAVYFAGPGAALYRTDGTEAGTVVVKSFATIRGPIVPVGAGGVAYLYANDLRSGTELWRTNGTAGGTALVQDIYPKTTTSNPQFLGTTGPTGIFFAEEPTHGRELWMTDGTPAGTSLLRDIRPGTGGSVPSANARGATLSGVLYFAANDGVNGNELWRTDGTTAGTFMVKNLTAGVGDSVLHSFMTLGNAVFFVKSGVLWRTDGTDPGTVAVNAQASFVIHGIIGDRLLMTGTSSATGTELWTSTGQPGGTRLLKDINPNNSAPNLSPPKITSDGTAAYFFAQEQFGAGNALWKTDGTPEGTVRVADVFPGANDWNGGGMGLIGDRLFFASDTGPLGRELWTSDGTGAGTRLFKDITPGSASSALDRFTPADGVLVFRAGDAVWRTDGSDAGTFKLADVPTSIQFRDPADGSTTWQAFNGAVYFRNTRGDALWKTDGSVAGTVVAANLAYPTDASPAFLPLADALLVTGDDGLHGTELWRITPDGAGPSVTAARFDASGGNASHRLEFRFDQAMAPKASDASLVFFDTARLITLPIAAIRINGGPADVIAFAFPECHGTLPAGTYRVTLRAASVTAADGDPLARDYSFEFAAHSTIANRYVFYNGSAADGGSTDITLADDNALAPTRALLPGEIASSANVSHYSRGMNGVMIDVIGWPLNSAPAVYNLGLDVHAGDGTSWSTAQAPSFISYRPAPLPGGATRLTMTWPDGTFKNRWLRITVRSTPDTGLASPDVFYFGNLIGDTGDAPPGVAPTVNARDLAAVRANLLSTTPAALARYDFNHDGVINALDVSVARMNQGATLKIFTAPPGPPAPAAPPPIPSPRRTAPSRRAADYVL